MNKYTFLLASFVIFAAVPLHAHALKSVSLRSELRSISAELVAIGNDPTLALAENIFVPQPMDVAKNHSISVTSLSRPVHWTMGDEVEIKWISKDVTDARVYLYKDGMIDRIIREDYHYVTDEASLRYRVPIDLEPGARYSIRVRDVWSVDGTVYDDSRAYFSAKALPPAANIRKELANIIDLFK